eukprot:jgi/Botrbrau1/21852/Bobra.0190s0065.1
MDVWRVAEDVEDVWLLDGQRSLLFEAPDLASLPKGDLMKACAHWVDQNGVAWRIPAKGPDGKDRTFRLHWSADAALSLTRDGVSGADGTISMAVVSDDLPGSLLRQYPHLQGCTYLQLPDTVLQQLHMAKSGTVAGQTGALLKAQLAASVKEHDGTPVDATSVQIQGALDQLKMHNGPLGAHVTEEGVGIHVWAPTAQSVELLLWEGPRGGEPLVVPMTEDSQGTWSAQVDRGWVWKYYTFRVRVFSPWRLRMETYEASDPYARALAADGIRTQIAALDDPTLAPPGWAEDRGPANFRNRTDISIYELHVRDFSASDASVREDVRGKFVAFAEDGTAGVQHLQRLAAAGITHLHLLPVYDFGSVPELSENQRVPEGDLESFGPDSPDQQAAIMEVAEHDAFQWGYDPVHWGVPEGSYCREQDGAARTLDFRVMVQALHRIGLNVVLDVVYNHTFQSTAEADPKHAVLDKLVPGYYHRRREDGAIENSTCCNNTASELAMCERLIIDDIVHWAKTYKVDGFRFDIMGHLLVSSMKKIQAALASLTLERDGVDGSRIYLYGEAWDFGEMACNQRGRNASQLNIGGTGLGSFNDRFRDAVLGGSPFANPRLQGFVTGLALQPNSVTLEEANEQQQKDSLRYYTDLLRLSLAGNLRDYRLVDRYGANVKGYQLEFGGAGAGYTRRPCENIIYAACHDNETLFDQIMLKAAEGASLEERVRMNGLALALVALAQGVPFFHAGDDLLRSKSLDRDSYNSGDWFNRLDWSMQSNNFGVGLPPFHKNEHRWPILGPLLAREDLKPGPALIAGAHHYLLELLQVRYSSPLLRLAQAEDVVEQVTFSNVGPDQVLGVVVMDICSAEQRGLKSGVQDPRFARISVVFNARTTPFTGSWPLGAQRLRLHPIQQESCDPTTREAVVDSEKRLVTVPPRTAAVFVEDQSGRPPSPNTSSHDIYEVDSYIRSMV